LDLWWNPPVDAGVVKHLRERKVEAKEVGRKGKKPWVKYGDELLEVQGNAARIGELLLDNEHMSVVVEPNPLKGMPTVMVALKSFFLHQVGQDAAAAAAQSVVYEIAGDLATDEQLDPKMTGADLYVDVQGWRPTLKQITPRRMGEQCEGAVNERLYTRAVKCTAHLEKRFEGCDYGSKASGISGAIYNKTLELEVSGKTWFEEIWAKSGNYRATEIVNGEEVKQDVWRLEFRIKRKGLTEFMKLGATENFSRWEDVRKHLDGLWSYLTRFWLVMRGARSKSDRLANPIDPFWQQFVDMGELLFSQKGIDTVLRRKLHKVAERGTAAAAGYLVQLHACAQWDERNHRRTFDQNLSGILEGVREYMRDRSWDPELRARARYHREWSAMEHLHLMGEDVEEAA